MSSRFSPPSKDIQDIISKTLLYKPKKNDTIFYIDGLTNDIRSCLYKDFDISFSVLYFLTYDDVKTCEKWLVGVNKEIEREIINSMSKSMSMSFNTDQFADVSKMALGGESVGYDMNNAPTATNVDVREDFHVGMKRFGYLNSEEMRKVLTHYTGIYRED